MRYKRVLLKISGEALSGPGGFGIDSAVLNHLAHSIKQLVDAGIQIGIVSGGGNIFRGIHLETFGIPRTPADQMGMLATLINGIALREALYTIGCKATVLSGLDCPCAVEKYTWTRAMDLIEANQPVIFVGGTGNPYFTTDTAAALRAGEIGADLLLKATKVDGVFDKDPNQFVDATLYHYLTYSQVLEENLKVMDGTAIALCRNNKIPVIVFNMSLLGEERLIELFKTGSRLGTLIEEKRR